MIPFADAAVHFLETALYDHTFENEDENLEGKK